MLEIWVLHPQIVVGGFARQRCDIWLALPLQSRKEHFGHFLVLFHWAHPVMATIDIVRSHLQACPALDSINQQVELLPEGSGSCCLDHPEFG